MRNLSKHFWRKLIVGSAIGLGVVVAATLVTVIAVFPAAAAVACPNCYGFARVAPHLYVERDADPAQRAKAEDVVTQGRGRVASFYGGLSGNPRVLICVSDDCYRRFGGGSRGMAILTFGLFLAPRGITPVIAAHELSHIELHRRLGLVRFMRHAVPQWFDEGVAVVVSDDPRYLAPVSSADRCLVAPDGDLPTNRAAWVETASHDETYAKAACRVSRWMAQKGGSASVVALLRQVGDGVSFNTAYAKPQAAKSQPD
ncbi:MAG TPA: hypothetical protein VL492_08450 [Methylovirgula sp.]|nr:hypothetical protein [Methylovirgula sp.]